MSVKWHEFVHAAPKSFWLSLWLEGKELPAGTPFGVQADHLRDCLPEAIRPKNANSQITIMWNGQYLAQPDGYIVAGSKTDYYMKAYQDGNYVINDGVLIIQAPSQNRLMEIVDLYQQAQAMDFHCKHGLRVHRNGVKPTGQYWEGFFCTLRRDNEDQCEPVWVPFGEMHDGFNAALAEQYKSWSVK